MKNQNGFTIIELLISTAVLSTMLVMATIIMMSLGNLYYKGVNQAKIQNNTRNIVDEISDKLSLTGTSGVTQATATDGKSMAYCINSVRYVYTLGKQLKETPTADDQSKHVLWRDIAAPGDCKPTDGFLDAPTTPGTELMIPNARLTQFSINPLIGPYNVKIGAAYGDKDLLLGEVTTGDNVKCAGGLGNQYCAVSYLSTTVAKRLR